MVEWLVEQMTPDPSGYMVSFFDHEAEDTYLRDLVTTTVRDAPPWRRYRPRRYGGCGRLGRPLAMAARFEYRRISERRLEKHAALRRAGRPRGRESCFSGGRRIWWFEPLLAVREASPRDAPAASVGSGDQGFRPSTGIGHRWLSGLVGIGP